ncbi:fungal-specific transcription factor domain-containing protein [Coniochaeta sp. 2T2.1]|nr:fungal-specific transcription factor domain-containing protein [Coniochaeta sp. 2T2.1]
MTSTGSESKSLPDTVVDISMQENVSPRVHAPRQSKQQIRHRASVACASCRDRRIRCVVPKGAQECTQCKRSGTECVIKNDDERRRPISKAYMSSLSERINLLESMLKGQGVQPPPAVHPPKTRQEAQAKQQNNQQSQSDSEQNQGQDSQELHPIQESIDQQQDFRQGSHEVPSPPDSYNDDFGLGDQDQSDSALANSQTFQRTMKEPSPFRNLDPKKEDIVHRLLSTKGNLSFDQLSGRFRFFGPTANSHVYAESHNTFDTREPAEQIRRAERIIRSLSQETHDYLMSCFWDYYNAPLQVVDRAAFEADRDSQNPKFYSSFLHITILAGGYRFADLDREDIQRITLGNRESTFHRESKYMLDIELERPGGIPSVQALLILGDMECGIGRDNTGWMYSGMANRLAFDIGLHLDCRGDNIPEQEIAIRHQVMRACVLYDKYWALFLGRPTSIKSQDIGMDLLSKKFSMLAATANPFDGSDKRTSNKATDTEVHEQLIELMEIAGKIVETRDHHKLNNRSYEGTMFGTNETEDNAYMQVISLDRQLQNWYRRLPDHLTWKPANIKSAPFSFFLLHQQYHVSMILLHRPWAKYGSITSSDGSSTNSHPSPSSTTTNNNNNQTAHPASQPLPTHQEQTTPTISMPNTSGLNGLNLSHSLTNHTLGLGDPQSLVDDSRTSLSRSICTQQAIRVSRIFWQHRQRFDSRKICVTGIQHAGTSAIALIAALAYQTSEPDRRSYLSYLEILSSAIADMSQTYQPAAKMDELLKAILVQLRPDNIYSMVPQRRENPASTNDGPKQKRHRPGQPARRASEFSRPPPPFFKGGAGAGGPTPPGSTGSFGLHHHAASVSTSMGPPTAGLFDGSNGFGLDFLSGSAVDFDGGDEGEDYVLVTPSSDGWGLGGAGGGGGGMDNGHGHAHSHAGFEVSMNEWMGNGKTEGVIKTDDTGGGGLSASLGSLHGGDVGGLPSAGGKVSDGGLNESGNGGMEWMGSEGGMDALSPVSLSGLVQSVDKAAAQQGGEGNGNGGRNHELDFFSF